MAVAFCECRSILKPRVLRLRCSKKASPGDCVCVREREKEGGHNSFYAYHTRPHQKLCVV